MDRKALKLFCDTVRLRSFSRGAAANHVSQSAASQAIQQLESEPGVALIDRRRCPLVLTEDGRIFLDGCEGLLEGLIAFIEQPEVIEKILTHLGLWPAPAHSPPVAGYPVPSAPQRVTPRK